MRLSVSARIALVMSTVVAVNIVAGALTTALYAKAATSGAAAQAASMRASRAAVVSEHVTEFLGGATDLALSVSRATPSEEKSRLYGELIGEDQIVETTLASLLKTLPSAEAAENDRAWQHVRLATYFWVNGEARDGGAGFRIAQDSAGRFRASVASNLSTPTILIGLEGPALRTAVRDQAERLKFFTLGGVVSRADSDVRQSAIAESQARSAAQIGTVLLALLNVLVAAALGIVLYRGIARPLLAARGYADRVAHGEYDATLARHSDDEIGVLTAAVEKMKDNLVHEMTVMREMAGAVLFTADSVHAAATRAAESLRKPGVKDGDVRSELEHVEAGASALMTLSADLIGHQPGESPRLAPTSSHKATGV